MSETPKVLSLIPARGGSRSIRKKNSRLLGGHPLLAYSIAAGRASLLTDRVIVSTDDPEIATVAKDYGAEVPFMRPPELAQDDTLDLPVFEHALRWLADHESYRPEIVVQLRPTSPFRPPGLVDRAIELLLDHDQADSVRGVIPSGQNPYKMWRMSDVGPMQPLLAGDFDEPYNMPRQELPPTFWQTGHIDAIRISTITELGSISGRRVWPLHIDPKFSIDIDNQVDWERAEWILARGELEIVWPGARRRPLPTKVALLVLDFDGTMTDDRVWVDQEGRESVAAHRGDGWGVTKLVEAGVEVVVLSTEVNPVVAARCAKLGLPVVQGVSDKRSELQRLFADRGVDPKQSVYLGNDVNDLPCFPLVACAVVVADAHPETRRAADLILSHPGGHGAVRELCDMLMESGSANG